jgi:hypothetical protein
MHESHGWLFVFMGTHNAKSFTNSLDTKAEQENTTMSKLLSGSLDGLEGLLEFFFLLDGWDQEGRERAN